MQGPLSTGYLPLADLGHSRHTFTRKDRVSFASGGDVAVCFVAVPTGEYLLCSFPTAVVVTAAAAAGLAASLIAAMAPAAAAQEVVDLPDLTGNRGQTQHQGARRLRRVQRSPYDGRGRGVYTQPPLGRRRYVDGVMSWGTKTSRCVSVFCWRLMCSSR